MMNKFFIIPAIFLIFLFSSFDIAMNVVIGGFKLRGIYFLELILLSFMLVMFFQGKYRKVKFLYASYFMVWVIFIIMFIPNTTILTRSIGYALWLILSGFLIFLLSNLIRDKFTMDRVFRYYIYSFVLMALFGLLQFVLGLIGIDLFVMQWWLPGKLARINGFSYEPSFYASYLFIGWTILFYMQMSLYKGVLKQKTFFIIITLALILSSSRMVIGAMCICVFIYVCISIFNKIRHFKLLQRDVHLIVIGSLLLSVILHFIIKYFIQVKFLIAGLGIFGTAAHSSATRTHELSDTFGIFLNSPIIGYSLGGIAPAIANLRGTVITQQLEAKSFEGMSVIFEVLAASGIFGFVFFAAFFLLLFYRARKTAKRIQCISINQMMMINALSFALFWEFFVLSMNQNILRPYFWILVGMLSASIIIGRKMIYYEKISH